MFRCDHHHQGARYLSLLELHLLKQSIKIVKLTNVTLASSNSALPEDGDHTDTCWRCNVNFNTHFKKLVHQLVIKL